MTDVKSRVQSRTEDENTGGKPKTGEKGNRLVKIGQRVLIDGLMGGRVAGIGTRVHGDSMEQVLLVDLDVGRWTEDRASFVSTLVVHPDNATLDEAMETAEQDRRG